MPHQEGQEQQEGKNTQGCQTFPVCQLSPHLAHAHSYLPMPCRSLKLSFSSGCCGLPALSMNTRRDGALLRTCQQGGKENSLSAEAPLWGVRLLCNAVRKPESIWGKADASVYVPPCLGIPPTRNPASPWDLHSLCYNLSPASTSQAPSC